jgi:hypothetical protein
MKLMRELCRRHLAGRRWLTFRAARRKAGFVVTVPPPLAGPAIDHATSATTVRVAEPMVSSPLNPSFAQLGH